MTTKIRWAVILAAGLAANDVWAQATVDAPPVPPEQSPPPQKSPANTNDSDPAPQRPSFEGVDGIPLPPEVQRELEEALKKKVGDFSPEAIEKAAPNAVRPKDSAGDIVVTGARPRGAVISDVPPERTLSATDIRATGATTIAELLDVLGPQLGSDRGRDSGRPIILLNGRRITSFLEILRLPTEAIERTEIFPEDVALSYGFPATQKLVNIVTYEKFGTQIGEIMVGASSEGGRSTLITNGDFLRLRGDNRINIDASYERSELLLESERGIIQVPGVQGRGQFRSLLPTSERVTVNAAVARPLIDDVMFSLNGRFSNVRDDALVGPALSGALNRDTDTRTGRLATSLSGLAGKWLWTFTGGYDVGRNITRTDNPLLGRDEGRSKTETVSADLLLNGSPFALPAGPVAASIRSGFELRDFSSQSLVNGLAQQASIARDQGSVQASLDLPLTGERSETLSWLGRLSVNVNGEVTRLSDFGLLNRFGYGLNWAPAEALSFLASVNNETGAPRVEQLGGPIVVTPNANIFDFATGTTVDLIRVSGGNPRLLEDDRRVVSIAGFAAPFAKTDLKFRINYTDIRILDPIASFPIATQIIQDAFPERFERGASGQLVRIDGRAVNFVRSNQRQIRTAIDFTRTLDKVPPWLRNANLRSFPAGIDPAAIDRPDRIVIKAEPGSALAKSVESLDTRLTFNISHIWRLRDTVVVREGVPELDLLSGDALDQRGGRARHEVELQAGAFKRGIGARLTARWQSATTIQGPPTGTAGGADRLRFSQPLILNLNLSATPENSLRGKVPAIFKGARFGLSIVNLLNDRPKVRDATGLTPINFQSAFLDPLGRVINLSIRKRF